MRVVLCTPTLTRPFPAYLAALEASIPELDKGYEHSMVFEVGCPYISAARSKLLRKATAANADVIVFLDHDVSWGPTDLCTLIDTPGDVVAGTYRFKKSEHEYMGRLSSGPGGTPLVRGDGVIQAELVPAGFLKITKEAVVKITAAHPELAYGPPDDAHLDLFHHGAEGGTWWGEDYAFSRRWRALGESIWLAPNLNIGHHAADGVFYPGNFHEFMLRQPGGANAQRQE
jgi:hypothetical protein